MMKIRIKFAYREPRILICEVILPILMVILSAVLMGVSLKEKTGIFQYDIGKIPDNLITHVGYPQTTVSQEVAQQFIDYQYTKDGFNAKLFEGDNFVGENRKETAKNFDEFVMSNPIDGWKIFSVFINRIEEDPQENIVYYDLTTLVDPTQAEAVGYAAQAAMTSIFRAELQDETAEFTIGRGAFPRIGNTSAILRMVLAGITVVNFCIALGLTTSSMAGNIAKERTDSLKHQQIVSGGSKFSYWMAMFIVDFGKLLPAFISFIIIVIVLDVNIPFFYVFAILCLISILP